MHVVLETVRQRVGLGFGNAGKGEDAGDDGQDATSGVQGKSVETGKFHFNGVKKGASW